MTVTITRPDDWHLHLRDGVEMADAVGHSARVFSRALIMPNLRPPVTTLGDAEAYRDRIRRAVPKGARFEPLMTLFLTDLTTPEVIADAAAGGVVAAKLYPAGATTNSEAGVTDIERVMPTFEAMAEHGVPLLVHGEIADVAVDIFDREREFIDRVLTPLVDRVQELKVVFEHITTSEAVTWVLQAPPRVAATITPHHLMFDRNAMFSAGISPHFFCLPVLKRERHREALVWAATSGSPRFFLGTDSAPHPRSAKETAHGCAGIFSSHAALELYTEVFSQAGALDLLEGFASHHGADFYGLPRNRDTVTLIREKWRVPESYPFGAHEVVPLGAGSDIAWRVVGDTNPR